MCRHEGMGITPWGALGGGKFKSEQQRQAQGGRVVKYTESDIKISLVLESIAQRHNTLITSVALAYVMHKTPYVFPIVGGRKIEHLRDNIEALTLRLSHEEIQEIEHTVPFDLGFPHSFLWGEDAPEEPQEVGHMKLAGTFDYVPGPKVAITKLSLK
jgi:aryl-alcohol dehydrogenase-like predicted oxidoreductase